MSRISDATKLDRISIPGTHDTGARFGGFAVECQVWTLPDQLDAGIRYLDIRCRPLTNGDFTIHHGASYQNKTFRLNDDSVLPECKRFLAENPTECLIMRIKQEHSPQDGAPGIADTFRSNGSAASVVEVSWSSSWRTCRRSCRSSPHAWIT